MASHWHGPAVPPERTKEKVGPVGRSSGFLTARHPMAGRKEDVQRANHQQRQLDRFTTAFTFTFTFARRGRWSVAGPNVAHLRPPMPPVAAREKTESKPSHTKATPTA